VRSEQPSFTDVEYGNRRRVSRRERFLTTMDATIPWVVWVGLIEPFYFAGKKGRKPKPVPPEKHRRRPRPDRTAQPAVST